MLQYLIQQDVQKWSLIPINLKPLSLVDLYFQVYFQQKSTLIKKSQLGRSYLFMVEIKNLENVFVSFEAQTSQTQLRFRFRPTQLISFNRQLTIGLPRSIIDLRNQLQFLNRDQTFAPFKWYIDRNGYMTIQMNCFLVQFLNPHNVEFILNKTLCEVTDLFHHIIPQMLSYINLESILPSFERKNQSPETQEQPPSIIDKFKYMNLLNEVYKSHRIGPRILQQRISKPNQNIFPKKQTFARTNTLIQSDTNYIELLEKQKKDLYAKFQEVLRVIHPKLNNKKDYLKMPKMRKVQIQFQQYVKSVKKDNLEIYYMTNINFRIVKGIQNHKLIKPAKTLSADGSHSVIHLGIYTLHLADTLFTYQQIDINQEHSEQKVITKPLITKTIKNYEHEPSVKSFENEIDFLYHVKDKRSKFIATYFLPLDKYKKQVRQVFSDHYSFNLKEYLQTKKRQSNLDLHLSDVLDIAENILFAMIFLVENCVLHRDLKPFNIMMDQNLKARLIDFGSCCPIIYCNEFSVGQKKLLTTPAYQIKYKECPGEIQSKYKKHEYEQHIMYDVYSFGQTFKEMADYLNGLDSLGSQKQINIAEIIEMIVSKCKDPDPMQRITFDELLFLIMLLKDAISKK